MYLIQETISYTWDLYLTEGNNISLRGPIPYTEDLGGFFLHRGPIFYSGDLYLT